ncbi:dihydropteroate synthase [Sphingorhabdus sp. EL138]|uniref:dihydropteroate synthase n=1 Tax=Sphingorhabdus sp. EL138 TaxID=2073156 RepID=UPI0025D5AFC5|nr:dihydropteroate synthase [Sphingorhabdus sp. EL138]
MTKIYLRPTGFVESPQRYEGEGLRLAGTMLWFSQIEYITRDIISTQRQVVPVGQWDAFVAALPQSARERCALLLDRITAPRAALQLGAHMIRLDQPHVMAIINATPDSFADGGKNVDPEIAAEAAVAMLSAGASIIDIGGESTRPGAPLVWEGDELNRVAPLIRRLAGTGAAISIDTRKAFVMDGALQAGATMINDISALLYDDRAVEVARKSKVPVVLMHAPSQSSDPHKDGNYDDVVYDVFDWLEQRVSDVEAAGLARETILVDPGIGFGKILSDNLAIINNLAIYHGLGCALLFGASRKRLIGALSNEVEATDRLGGSIFLAMKAVEQGAHIVRVHDAAETVQAMHVWRGLRDAALTAPI